MDRIIVRTNDDLIRVLEWSCKLEGLAVELPFVEGEIWFQEEGEIIRFKEKSPGVVELSAWGENPRVPKRGGDNPILEPPEWYNVVSWVTDLESDTVRDVKIPVEGEQKVILGHMIAKEGVVINCTGKFRAIMLFAAYYREEVMGSRVISRESTGGSKPGKRSNKRKLTIRRYTIGSEMLSELPAPKRVWKGYSESFGVRGHYRHMKSGKVVWVRPFTKKGRSEKKSDKEYIL